MEQDSLITLTADIVAAHVANNSVAVGDIGNLVRQVHEALSRLGAPLTQEVAEKVPVVSIKASVKPDYIICMECGRKQKTLKRHLQVAHGMTPQEYRKDYGLPDSYPMTSPEYSRRRQKMAVEHGLGRKKDSAKEGRSDEAPQRAGSAPARAKKAARSASEAPKE